MMRWLTAHSAIGLPLDGVEMVNSPRQASGKPGTHRLRLHPEATAAAASAAAWRRSWRRLRRRLRRRRRRPRQRADRTARHCTQPNGVGKHGTRLQILLTVVQPETVAQGEWRRFVTRILIRLAKLYLPYNSQAKVLSSWESQSS